MNELEARLEQNRRDQERLREEETRLLKEQEKAKEKRFYVGTKFTSYGDTEYLLIASPENREKAYLLNLNTMGYKNYEHVETFWDADKRKRYTKKLPTCYPEDLGSEYKDYGIY